MGFNLILLTKVLLVILISSATANPGHPTFDNTYEEIVLEEGFEAEVLCNASGDQPLKYTWYNKFDEEIPERGNLSVFSRTAPSGSFLVFDVAETDHSGLYSCNAYNVHGMTSKVFRIFVHSTLGNKTSNETVSIQRVDVKNVTESSVEFSIRASGYLHTFVVTFTEKIEKLNRTMKFKAGEKIEIKDLISSGNYTFRFKAESADGVSSKWTKDYTIVLLPDAPELIFRSLNDGAVKIEWFRKFNDSMRGSIDYYSLSYNSMRMQRGTYWEPNSCVINVTLPACTGPRYKITDLSKNSYYEFRLSAHTETGYGKSSKFKVFVE